MELSTGDRHQFVQSSLVHLESDKVDVNGDTIHVKIQPENPIQNVIGMDIVDYDPAKVPVKKVDNRFSVLRVDIRNQTLFTITTLKGFYDPEREGEFYLDAFARSLNQDIERKANLKGKIEFVTKGTHLFLRNVSGPSYFDFDVFPENLPHDFLWWTGYPGSIPNIRHFTIDEDLPSIRFGPMPPKLLHKFSSRVSFYSDIYDSGRLWSRTFLNPGGTEALGFYKTMKQASRHGFRIMDEPVPRLRDFTLVLKTDGGQYADFVQTFGVADVFVTVEVFHVENYDKGLGGVKRLRLV